MPHLITVSGHEAVRRFQRAGWKLARIHGSHAILTMAGNPINLAVPLHEELGIGLLRKLVHLAGLDLETFHQL